MKGAVSRQRYLAAVAGEDGAVRGEVGRGDGQTEPRAELRAAAGGLQNVGGIALFGDRRVGRGRHQHDIVAVGIAHGLIQLRRRRCGPFGAEAHVDGLRAVVGCIDDRRDDAAFG
jgi:hypothetical protein